MSDPKPPVTLTRMKACVAREIAMRAKEGSLKKDYGRRGERHPYHDAESMAEPSRRQIKPEANQAGGQKGGGMISEKYLASGRRWRTLPGGTIRQSTPIREMEKRKLPHPESPEFQAFAELMDTVNHPAREVHDYLSGLILTGICSHVATAEKTLTVRADVPPEMIAMAKTILVSTAAVAAALAGESFLILEKHFPEDAAAMKPRLLTQFEPQSEPENDPS